MQKLRNITIRLMMIIILGTLCVLFGSVSLYSAWSLSQISEGNQSDNQIIKQMAALSQGNDQYFRFTSRLNRLVEEKAEGKEVDFTQAQLAMENMEKQITYMKSVSPGPMDAKVSKELMDVWQALFEQGVKKQMELALNGTIEQYEHHAKNVTPALSRELGNVSENFNNAANIKIDSTIEEVDELIEVTQIVIIISAILGGVILILTDRYLVAMLQKPLESIRQHFVKITEGDLSQSLEPFGNNCAGRLIPLLNDMQNSLHEAVSTIRTGSESIYRGASEIAKGNNDLASRTEEQATALEQTAASMEEITAAVNQNMEHAYQARELAEVASVTVEKGNELAESVVTTMDGISDSSSKIADIINVINNIAFQTNILALNASVEAARAGSYGRGFMVVANEVRNLAGDSAKAAKEIEVLIADSTTRVRKGASLVSDMEKTMEDILTGVKQVTSIMKEITIASEEQSKGIGQVSVAITQMDGVTQQNSSLVEQVSAAAISLERQTEELQLSVQKFNLAHR
ncbi:methyl-accepting chemotaxis protein [Proteus terrae]|uniref:methyl-accepting chemotaxis protein n=1 Tax=Proteus terrae TaxID=1574161 RepID=UPI000BFBF4FC|nr:methyl-accepting chemotaxis protein [Proteus terrae]ATM99867.1 methyl-accepting chemotaxis protein [Proteus vulgaris]MBG2836288.1 Tar ligand binding domain-containing protein [Proteus terrae subsp. cibarius]MBG2868402.1 Tar ligand binding domain-containing protein [Proteus terrae subsp. cibarius]MBJ2109508.1 Tar ligand binding domain-containing protein [Proteus terrae]MBJ2133452.1 Tar ligand binding domain-containing protein [Proteus terrae]